ncbi:hypothetical protein GCM10023085_58970 [Actinomadura viridis]|uniref:Uncharacterized protein n=1 Tax=Actinomadura viridis TaxID=58110 RepID=A0A931DRA0_9ACTN|nr:hypothetical protein [Actinomadura viridis]MBG6093309.1 hypothetical protein [Actinomadura viridis]
MDVTILAQAGHIGRGFALWLVPIIIFGALLTWLTLTILASSRRIHPERRKDQSPHRGPEEGGLYQYSPGIYSHTHPPGEAQAVRYPSGGPEPEPESGPGPGGGPESGEDQGKTPGAGRTAPTRRSPP